MPGILERAQVFKSTCAFKGVSVLPGSEGLCLYSAMTRGCLCARSPACAEPLLWVLVELQDVGGVGLFLLADNERPNGKKEIGHKRGYCGHKRLSARLKTTGITHDRPMHFLRKVFGSVVATRHGLFTACNYLGHSSVIVTEEHYAALLEKPVVDLMADVTVG